MNVVIQKEQNRRLAESLQAEYKRHNVNLTMLSNVKSEMDSLLQKHEHSNVMKRFARSNSDVSIKDNPNETRKLSLQRGISLRTMKNKRSHKLPSSMPHLYNSVNKATYNQILQRSNESRSCEDIKQGLIELQAGL
eukprot:UN30336